MFMIKLPSLYTHYIYCLHTHIYAVFIYASLSFDVSHHLSYNIGCNMEVIGIIYNIIHNIRIPEYALHSLFRNDTVRHIWILQAAIYGDYTHFVYYIHIYVYYKHVYVYIYMRIYYIQPFRNLDISLLSSRVSS